MEGYQYNVSSAPPTQPSYYYGQPNQQQNYWNYSYATSQPQNYYTQQVGGQLYDSSGSVAHPPPLPTSQPPVPPPLPKQSVTYNTAENRNPRPIQKSNLVGVQQNHPTIEYKASVKHTG